MESLSFDFLFPLILTLVAIGGVAGFLGGLMGIGGGTILVPGLYYSLTSLGFPPEHMMHVAVGTSLAVIVPSGMSSAWAHWKHDAVRMDLVKRLGPGILVGVGLGTVLAGALSGPILKAVFAIALIPLALFMVFGQDRFTLPHAAVGPVALGGVGSVIGTLSTLMGIGGAAMSVPYMTACRIPIHQAVGTAAALGIFIAVPGVLGFTLIGQDSAGLPPFSLGYISLPAWGTIVPVSVVMAQLGAKAAHALPVGKLRGAFAVLIVLVSARMLYGVFYD